MNILGSVRVTCNCALRSVRRIIEYHMTGHVAGSRLPPPAKRKTSGWDEHMSYPRMDAFSLPTIIQLDFSQPHVPILIRSLPMVLA